MKIKILFINNFDNIVVHLAGSFWYYNTINFFIPWQHYQRVLFFHELKEGRKDKLKGPQMQIFSQNPTEGNENDNCSVIKINVDISTSTEAEDLKDSTLL